MTGRRMHQRCMALDYLPGPEHRLRMCGGKLGRELRWDERALKLYWLRGRFCVDHGSAWGRRPR